MRAGDGRQVRAARGGPLGRRLRGQARVQDRQGGRDGADPRRLLQLCAKTDGCNYWIVHNTKGCFMHKKTKKGVLKPAWKKKGFMAHGVCNNYVAAWKV